MEQERVEEEEPAVFVRGAYLGATLQESRNQRKTSYDNRNIMSQTMNTVFRSERE